jgi:SPP1 family predicted phage head-tail adaptor
MQAGKLRNYITVRNLIETQSTITGALVQSWSTVLNGAWASVEPLQGREYFAASQFQSKITTKITLRNSTVNITPKMIAVYGTHIYEIESVIKPDMRNNEVQLMCYERVAT